MKKTLTEFCWVLFALSFAAILGCAQQDTTDKEEGMAAVRKAVSEMTATTGNNASGTVTFTEVEGGIRVEASFTGVAEGEHGFHIHETGDCSSGDGKSAGGHWNPAGNPHAGPSGEMRHVGDLGNISANAAGDAVTDFVDPVLTFDGPNSILGKGVILHANMDDLSSQPTGAAGARISCGVIESVE